LSAPVSGVQSVPHNTAPRSEKQFFFWLFQVAESDGERKQEPRIQV